MALHAFDSVKYNEETGELLVAGTSERDLDAGAEIHVAVIDVTNEDRRCQGEAQLRAPLFSWTATLENPPSKHKGETFPPFRDDDVVFVAGMSKDATLPVFVWAERFTIDKA